MIETDRLVLRPFCAEDAADVFEYLKEPMVNCFACMKVHSMEEAQKAVMERVEDAEYTFAIVLKENGPEPIGSIAVVGIHKKVDGAAMGYCMSRAHWGKGVMTEALTAVIDFFFDEVGFNRIDADHAVDNPASGRVMEKSGMRYEGTHRQAVRTNCGIVDIKKWAILKSDR